MSKEEILNIDAAAWTGDGNTRAAGSARILIVLIYCLFGPMVGAFCLLAGEAAYAGEVLHIGGAILAIVISAMTLVPHAYAIVPAFFCGIAVAHFARNRSHSFTAAMLGPVFIYMLVYPTGGFAGAQLTFGGLPRLALLGAAIAASLTCWLLTLPLQRRT